MWGYGSVLEEMITSTACCPCCDVCWETSSLIHHCFCIIIVNVNIMKNANNVLVILWKLAPPKGFLGLPVGSVGHIWEPFSVFSSLWGLGDLELSLFHIIAFPFLKKTQGLHSTKITILFFPFCQTCLVNTIVCLYPSRVGSGTPCRYQNPQVLECSSPWYKRG